MSEDLSSLDAALGPAGQIISEDSESSAQHPVTPSDSSTSEDVRRLKEACTSSSASPVPPGLPPEVATPATGAVSKLSPPQLQQQLTPAVVPGGAECPLPSAPAGMQRSDLGGVPSRQRPAPAPLNSVDLNNSGQMSTE